MACANWTISHPFFRDLYAACDVQGIPVETAISEYAPGQLEVTLRHRPDALRATDEAIMYKRAVKGVAVQHGVEATFMAKPFSDIAGSGMHLHVSLADKDGKNAFASEAPEGTELLKFAVGGMRRAARGFDGGVRAERQLLSPVPRQLLCAGGADLGHQQPHRQFPRAGGPGADPPHRAPGVRRRRQSLPGGRRPAGGGPSRR